MTDIPKNIVLAALGLVPSTGGTSQSLRNFQNALNAQVVSFTDAAVLASEGSAVRETVHVSLGRGPAARLFAWAGGKARAEAEKIAASAELLSCHILYRYHAHWVAKWARRREIPYWVVPHGCLDPYVFTYRSFVKRAWMALFGKRFLAGASHVIFATERERQKASERYHGANCRVVNWPVAPVELHDAQESRQRVRRSLDIGDHERLLLYFGRLHEMKRPLETAESVARANREFVHLAVVGPEETITAAEVRAEGDRHGLQRRLHVIGPVYGFGKQAWLHACDGFVSLSKRENFGYSAAEALSAGKPVILSRGNDLSGELAPSRCGWFLCNDDPASVADAIREWADAPARELHARGARGREFVRRELTFERFSARIKSLASEAMQGRRPGTTR